MPVGGGQTGQGPWQAVAYRTTDGWTCLEVIGGLGGSSCGQGPDALLGIGTASGAPDKGSLVSGGTAIGGAAAVSVVLDDGSIVPGTVVPVPPPVGAPGVKVFVVPIPAGRSPRRVDLLDAQGGIAGIHRVLSLGRNAAASACRHPRAHPSPVSSHAGPAGGR